MYKIKTFDNNWQSGRSLNHGLNFLQQKLANPVLGAIKVLQMILW
jgi:hypothetical protein